ncbi:hypothetical protein NUW54_g7684 [Trametes sanguinea]|uniref:Uncharacterized protein n=1 Tax=Trametes sanguinea TaxID=158606 RepID=A0ACC1PJL6_9APHY|nr:hypothetical protein NUW54_g7684 [Trametes sanguinea]
MTRTCTKTPTGWPAQFVSRTIKPQRQRAQLARVRQQPSIASRPVAFIGNGQRRCADARAERTHDAGRVRTAAQPPHATVANGADPGPATVRLRLRSREPVRSLGEPRSRRERAQVLPLRRRISAKPVGRAFIYARPRTIE